MVLRVVPSNPLPGAGRRATPRRWRQPSAGGGGGSADPPPHGLDWLRRLAWFVGLWVASVAALGVVSLAIKLAIGS